MDNEILKQILAELKSVNGRLDKLEQGQAEMKSDIREMKSDILHLKQGLAEAKSDIKEMKLDIKEMKADIRFLKTASGEAFRDIEIVSKYVGIN